MKTLARLLAPLLVCVLAALAHASDRFVVVPFGELRFDGAAPAPVDSAASMSGAWFRFGNVDHMEPYVVLDTPGEAYLDVGGATSWSPTPNLPLRLGVRTAHDRPITGRVFVMKPDLSGFEAHRFTLARAGDDSSARTEFYRLMEQHYQNRIVLRAPGAAWFRHQRDIARSQLAGGPVSDAAQLPAELVADMEALRPTPASEASFELFTGARALAENLDIERRLPVTKEETPTIDVATIEGVTTRALDWKALVKDKKPELDALAKSIPADQHAVFFPSFDAMVRVFDEVDGAGTPVLQFTNADVQDQRTKERYQTQLCMPLSSVARLLGPAIVQSVAITGSDPYLPSGTDIAVLFECKQPAVLEGYLGTRHAEAKTAGAKSVDGAFGATKYTGVRSADRRVSSYMARFDDTIVVANSPVQIERIAAARSGGVAALAASDEYVWFRDRYRKGDAGESALVVLTDATIRRWASPRERIGNSRRVRAASAMAEVQAASLDALVAGKIAAGAPAADSALPFSADFVWTKDGVFSPKFGSLEFLTPVSELSLAEVTESEKRGYEAFRRSFQNLWANFFDPIAVRLSFDASKLGADVTVMPLAVTTDYRELVELTRGATLGAATGDAHAESLIHFALAFGSRSQLNELFRSGTGGLAQQLGADPLGWIGDGVALYADRDAFWGELTAADKSADFVGENFYRMPVALHVAVKDPLKLAGFLTSLRAMSDSSAPGLVVWETRTWKEQGYVRISSPMATSELGGDAAAYYVAMPDAFVLSFREELVQRAIERSAARRAGKAASASSPEWLGSSVGLRIDREAIGVWNHFFHDMFGDPLQRAAWSAIPILNEWKRRYPDQDPAALHERLWHVRLVSPSGGAYVWNESLQTMEAADYGSPASPKAGPELPRALDGFTRGEFGLTFENDGLRARVELGRKHD